MKCYIISVLCFYKLQAEGLKYFSKFLRYDNCMQQIQHEIDLEIEFNVRNDFKYDNAIRPRNIDEVNKSYCNVRVHLRKEQHNQ